MIIPIPPAPFLTTSVTCSACAVPRVSDALVELARRRPDRRTDRGPAGRDRVFIGTGIYMESCSSIGKMSEHWHRQCGRARPRRPTSAIAFSTRLAQEGNATVDTSGTPGPISYLIVEFPGGRMTGEGLPILADLVDRGVIRVLDLAFVAKGSDGSVTKLSLQDLDRDGTVDLRIFEGASSGLVSQADLAEAAPAIAGGSAAAILVFENRWATDFVQALRRGGAELVAAGYIPQDDVLGALEDAER